MGLFFQRQVTTGNPSLPAIREALARTVQDEDIDSVASTIVKNVPAEGGEVKTKPVSLVVGIALVVILLGLAWVLATIVDPLLIEQAREQARTQGYEPPELQTKLLSDAARNVLVTAAGGLAGLILGDAVGTATSGPQAAATTDPIADRDVPN